MPAPGITSSGASGTPGISAWRRRGAAEIPPTPRAPSDPIFQHDQPRMAGRPASFTVPLAGTLYTI